MTKTQTKYFIYFAFQVGREKMLKQFKQNVEILEEYKITYFNKSLSLTNSRFHISWIIRRLLKGTVSVISKMARSHLQPLSNQV